MMLPHQMSPRARGRSALLTSAASLLLLLSAGFARAAEPAPCPTGRRSLVGADGTVQEVLTTEPQQHPDATHHGDVVYQGVVRPEALSKAVGYDAYAATHADAVAARGRVGGRRSLQQVLPPANNVLTGNCTGYPEPRRYVEAQSWWTDEGQDVHTQSRHLHLGACLPAVMTADMTIDIAVLLHNQLGTNRYLGGLSVRFDQGLSNVMSDWDVGFSCCSMQCSQAFRVKVSSAVLPGNGNTSLTIQAQLRTPSRDGVPSNEWSSTEIMFPITVNIPGKPAFGQYQQPMKSMQAVSWGHRPWQYAFVSQSNLIGAPNRPASGVIPLPTALFQGVRTNGETPTPTTSLFFTVNPVFHPSAATNNTIVLGRTMMSFGNFREPFFHMSSWFQEVPFLDTRTLPNGIHRVFLRADAFIPASRLPQASNASAPPLLRLGGTNSVVLLYQMTVAN